MIDQNAAYEALQTARDGGADFAELFFEDKDVTAIEHEQGSVQNIGSNHYHGVGLYLLDGTRSVYVYTNNMSREGLLALAKRGSDLLAAAARKKETLPCFQPQPKLADPNPVSIYPGAAALADKIRVLDRLHRICLDASARIASLSLRYFDTDQRVTIANSEGLWAEDRRVSTRIRVTPTLGYEGELYGDFFDFARAKGFEAYADETAETQIRREIRRMETTLMAPDAPSGIYPVVFEAGGSVGTFFHECCGHQFETRELSEGGIFWDKRGQQIASEKVTVIDDGTAPNSYGSAAIDDEGRPTRRNVMIENGVMKNALADRLGARKLNIEANGCGRRQNYTFAPGSRMSNTYLAEGSDDPDEMITSLAEGLFVTGIGGGYGGEEFSLQASSAWWIKNGAIDHPVKNATLLGKGDESLMKIDRVGRRLVWEEGGDFCGSDSGMVPVTNSGPRMRIMGMIIGGKDDGQ